MAKVKRLKQKVSARDNRRYFVVRGVSGKKIEEVLLEYLGILGFAKSNYVFVKKEGVRAVGSCVRESLNDVRAALLLSGIEIEKVSGTIKGLGI